MVTEWEREELGRLTHQRIKAFSHQDNEQQSPVNGRMTLQSMKSAQNKTETGEVKIKLLFERLKMAISTSLSGFFAPSAQRMKEDRCAVYGHNFPWGTPWKGVYPKCLDCGSPIKEASQLRGAVPKAEREKFRGFGGE
ncbi:MAG: hypothetical protein K2X27_17955 [Candidatus Obscuribacterales bacterium]|nr:hypothetical protein [Candidatus Obscuribacterales bacterium]